MKISSDFSKKIPSKYTCTGENISPPLTISDIPAEAKTLAIIVEDPDAPSKTWIHWIAFNIPISSSDMKITEETEKEEGINDFGEIGYGGPCPPSGVHNYHFNVYAIKEELTLSSGATEKEVREEMDGKILDEAKLVATYEK